MNTGIVTSKDAAVNLLQSTPNAKASVWRLLGRVTLLLLFTLASAAIRTRNTRMRMTLKSAAAAMPGRVMMRKRTLNGNEGAAGAASSALG
jgi:hypothetical protein